MKDSKHFVSSVCKFCTNKLIVKHQSTLYPQTFDQKIGEIVTKLHKFYIKANKVFDFFGQNFSNNGPRNSFRWTVHSLMSYFNLLKANNKYFILINFLLQVKTTLADKGDLAF